MANHYSALKRIRQTKKRTLVNRANAARLRHQIRAFRRALQASDVNAAAAALAETVSVIDHSVQKGVIKKNTAARYKSRLSHRLNTLKSPATA